MSINFSAINYSISAVSSISSGAHLDEATIRKLKALGIDPSKVQSKQQAELHSKLWSMANDLRGSMDASEFKNYILGLIFYRFLSEKLVKYVTAKLTLDIKDLAGKIGVTISQNDSLKVSIEKIETKIKEITAKQNASKTDLSSTQKVNATPEDLNFKLQDIKTRFQEIEMASSSMYAGQDMISMLNRMSLGI